MIKDRSTVKIDEREAYFRDKIVIISIVMGICVVYQHVRFDRSLHPIFNELHDFAFYIRKTCVPMFFAISGYLFFRGFSFSKLKSKLRRRVDTLLIPYLIWNVAYVVFMLIMSAAGLMNEPFEPDFTGLIKATLNAECSPLWFVRYLMLFVCIAPLTYFVLRHRFWGALLIMIMIGYNIYNYRTGYFDPVINVNSNTLEMFNYQFIFFATGAYAALCWSNQVETKERKKTIIALLIMAALIIAYWSYLRTENTALTNHLFRWIWIPVFWFSFDILPRIKVRPWMRFSFLIYCAHMLILYCTQGITSKVYPYLGHYSHLFALFEYLILGVATVWFVVRIGQLLKIHTPRVFSILTGARG